MEQLEFRLVTGELIVLDAVAVHTCTPEISQDACPSSSQWVVMMARAGAGSEAGGGDGWWWRWERRQQRGCSWRRLGSVWMGQQLGSSGEGIHLYIPSGTPFYGGLVAGGMLGE